MCAWQHNQLCWLVFQRIQLIFAHGTEMDVHFMSQYPGQTARRFDCKAAVGQIIRVWENHYNILQLAVFKQVPARFHEAAKIIGDIRLRLLRTVRTQSADIRFIDVIHIEIRIPQPLYSPRSPCRERICIFPFQNIPEFDFAAFSPAVRRFHIHDAGLLDQIWLIRRLGKDTIPYELIH